MSDEHNDHSDIVSKDREAKEANHTDEFEKICFLCRRPESKAGSMIDLPNNIHICTECMQKSFDTMKNSNLSYNDIMNLSNVSMIDLSNLHNQIPKSQKIKKKAEKSNKNVTVHIGLRTCCADRKNAWNSRQISIAAGDLAWIFACCRERSER